MTAPACDKPKEKKRHVVKGLKLTEVGLVDVPANPHSEILLFKCGDPEMPDQLNQPSIEDVTKQLAASTAQVATLTAELTSVKEGSAAQVADLTKKLEVANAELTKLAPKPTIELPVEIRKQLDDLEKSNNALHEALNKANDERLLMAFIGKVQNLSVVPVTQEALGDLCKRISQGKSTSADSDEVIRLLTAMSELVQKGSTTPITKAIGHASAVPLADIDATVKAKTTEIMKSNTGMTEAQAAAAVWRNNPGLYEEYLHHQSEVLAASRH